MSVKDYKNEAEGNNAPEEFYTDTVGKQIPGDKQKQNQQQPANIKPDWDKKIIKTASLNAEVKDYNSYYSSLREKIKSVGGYIAQEEQKPIGLQN